jgi:predicted TIM-barrel fold metal-dependent hydrolase
MPIVDFHAHYADPRWPALAPPSRPADLAKAWVRISERIGDFDGVLQSLADGGLDVRVLGAPPALLAPAGESLPAPAIATINDHLAERVAAHEGRLLGLATIDAFQGESAAEEAARALGLGLSGLVVDCQHGELLLDAPQARPLLEAASALGAPVFVHPISPVRLSRELAPLGRLGVSIARGTADAASLLALVSSGTLAELPGLRLVIPMLGGAALLYATLNESAERLRRETAPESRWHVYVDTMGFDPAAIRFAVDVVGVDHVLAGSDWPIWGRDVDRGTVLRALAEAGLDERERALVSGGNALSLLTREPVAVS